jgi:hypothetical protein
MDASEPEALARLRQVGVNEAARASREDFWTPGRDFADALGAIFKGAHRDEYLAALMEAYVAALREREPEVTSDEVIGGVFFSLAADLGFLDHDEWEQTHAVVESLFPSGTSRHHQELLEGWAAQGSLPRLAPSGFTSERGGESFKVKAPDGADIETSLKAGYRDGPGRLLVIEAHRVNGARQDAETDRAIHQLISPYAQHLYGRDIRSRAALVQDLDERLRTRQTEWGDNDIPVDGHPTRFRVTVLGDDYWVATAIIDNSRVLLVSHGVPLPTVRLTRR